MSVLLYNTATKPIRSLEQKSNVPKKEMFYWENLESQKFDSGITDAPWDETSYSK